MFQEEPKSAWANSSGEIKSSDIIHKQDEEEGSEPTSWPKITPDLKNETSDSDISPDVKRVGKDTAKLSAANEAPVSLLPGGESSFSGKRAAVFIYI